MKRTLFFLFLLLAVAGVCAKREKAWPQTLRNYPSGAVDEYHFRPGYVVVRGEIKGGAPSEQGKTLSMIGENQFTGDDFVKVISVDSTGHFCASVLVPYSQYFYLGYFRPAFAAVGDTLDVSLAWHAETDNYTVDYGASSGVTGEVNRIWPKLYAQFFGGEAAESPCETKDRQVMMEYKKRKLEEFRAIVCAVDADTLSLLQGCSDFAKDVLKSSLLACIPEQIGGQYRQYRWMVLDENRETPPEKLIRPAEWWDFLSRCEAVLLDNPCMLLAESAEVLINNLEFGPLSAYMLLGNDLVRVRKMEDPEELGDYTENFVLPSIYDRGLHRRMLEHRQGTLLSIADYYRMATDSICGRYRLNNNFMMQICLLHCALDMDNASSDAGVLHTVAERFAGAVPHFSNKIVAHHAVDAYRRFVVEREGHKSGASLSSEADVLFDALVGKYRGNVVFVDFWGLGCGPCRHGMLRQRADVEYFEGKPVRFLYVCNEKESPRADSEAFMESNGIKGEHIYLTDDEWNLLMEKFQFVGIPFCLLLDKEGNIVERNGEPSREVIEMFLNKD